MRLGRFALQFGVGILSVFTLSCALLKPFAPYEGPYGFFTPSIPPENATPLPVEIAKDIEAISEDGIVYYQNPSKQNSTVSPISASDGLVKPDAKDLDREQPIVRQSKESSDQATADNDPILGSSKGPLAKKAKVTTKAPLRAAEKLKITRHVSHSGKTVTYVVKRGDTLMEIAFDKHADYLRWREIYRDNRNKMPHWRRMAVGTVLSIHNVKYVYIKKEGKPYLIRKGDTLKSIARKLYGSPLHWERLWKNNPQLIKNPKKIYAGFTLYYPEIGRGDKAPVRREPGQSK